MTPSQKSPLFYGWKLSWLACFGNFMIHGGGVYLMNAFIEPFSDLYGWSRGEISTALGIGSFCGMAAAPFLASLAMRMSLRWIMLVGAIFGGISLFFLGWFTSLTMFTINFCVLWIMGQACGGVIANALMSSWFVKHRGKAFGIVNFGMSFSGAILPFIALVLIKYFTVQTATAVLGGFTLLVLVPGVWFLVRDTPASMGLLPDGEESDTPAAPEEKKQDKGAAFDPLAGQPAPTVNELLHSHLTWRVGIVFALGILAAAGIVGQLKPRFSDLGFDDFTAMGFMCATAFFVACGKYFWGWVSDKFPPIRTAKILFAYNIGAYLLAFLPPSLFTLTIFAIFCGIGVGGTWTMLPAVVVDIFGRTHFMAAYRVVSIFIFIKSFGYIIMGQSYQLTGSYDAAFICFSVMSAVSLFLLPKTGTKYMRPKAKTAESAQ
ncbi:MFS transporter [Desulfovibrio sp. OttesenSCG-928-O18]|nr:MFS transporter [Desulfovibrio sp. OttesenSCG-928-O18]